MEPLLIKLEGEESFSEAGNESQLGGHDAPEIIVSSLQKLGLKNFEIAKLWSELREDPKFGELQDEAQKIHWMLRKWGQMRKPLMAEKGSSR